jgi:hypothetical protein
MDSPDMDGATAAATPTDLVERPRRHASEAGADGGRIHDFLARWADALNSHDLDELDALVCEDVTWVDPAMFGDTVRGRAAVRAFHATLLHGFPDIDLLDFSQQIGILPPRDSRMLPLAVRAQRLVARVQRRRAASAKPRG